MFVYLNWKKKIYLLIIIIKLCHSKILGLFRNLLFRIKKYNLFIFGTNICKKKKIFISAPL